MLLKVRGPNLLKPFGPFLPEKVGGPKSAFTIVWPKKWEGPGPPGPLGDYGPALFSLSFPSLQQMRWSGFSGSLH